MTKQANAKWYKLILVSIIFVSILAGCKKDLAEKEKNFSYLIDWQLIDNVSKTSIQFYAATVPDINAIISQKELQNVNVYKITYKTKNVGGEEITASGAVLFPDGGTNLPLLSYQHGTLTNKEDAPSNYGGDEIKYLAPIISSTGYALSVPDYIGYGASAIYPHPYEHAKTLGSSSFDMLMAAKEFFDYNDITLSEKLFITGYSEGGNATMALHQHIEQNSDLRVTMSAPAAGAYNKTAFAKDLMGRDENLTFLPKFMWVLYTYNWIYELNRPWSEYVVEPDATTLEAVSDPMKLGEANINLNPQLLFTETTRTGVLNETDSEFLDVLAENDTYNWKPIAPITLYYGTDDDYVFPLNSETAYDALLANGANVEKVAYDGKNHDSAFFPYLLDAFELFESLK
ncbi:MAG: hypothetical protein HC831_09740 [Chloroflexia bacterium]|nr:hypothetical protein [Chloroflexia bacterium]